MSLSAEDRVTILELLVRADNAATDRDADVYAALFSEDAVMDGEKGEYQGRDAIRSAVGAVWASEGEATTHLTLNSVIEDDGGTSDEVVARSTLMIVSPGPPPAVMSISAITHRLVKVETRWRVVRRTIRAS
jgi:ketosteroid isomerase-like protein